MNNELKIEYFISSGPGGQRRNKKKTGVRIIHLPSGIMVHVEDQRSQSQNKKAALLILQKRLKKLRQCKKKRIPTKIPKSAKERYLQSKKERAEKKQLRRRVRY